MKKWHCNFSIPFSSFHSYTRSDSIKMNKFTTPLDQHYKNFDDREQNVPAFISWDSNSNSYNEINPKDFLKNQFLQKNLRQLVRYWKKR